jgi:uncharacterized protein YutE (UPF0331/DUF86 family)
MPTLEVILEKIESLRRCLLRIEEKAKLGKIYFLDNLDAQDVVVLNLERSVQLCVDMAAHIVARDEFSVAPNSMSESFQRLQGFGIVSEQQATRMIKAVGFRNLAVHEYAELDPEIVFKVATEHLDDFRSFVAAILIYLERSG